MCTFHRILLPPHGPPQTPLQVLSRVLEDTYSFRKAGLLPPTLPKAQQSRLLFFLLVHAVSGCHHPVLSDEGPSTGVIPFAPREVLEGNLEGVERKGGEVGVSLKALPQTTDDTSFHSCHPSPRSPISWARSGKWVSFALSVGTDRSLVAPWSGGEEGCADAPGISRRECSVVGWCLLCTRTGEEKAHTPRTSHPRSG